MARPCLKPFKFKRKCEAEVALWFHFHHPSVQVWIPMSPYSKAVMMGCWFWWHRFGVVKMKYRHLLHSDVVPGVTRVMFLGCISKARASAWCAGMVLEGAELCIEHMVKWKWSEEISAAGLAGKPRSLESVPGLGASSLGWGTTKLYHSHLVRARHEINAFCAREEENTVAVSAGGHASWSTSREAVSGVFLVCRDHREGSQGWIRPAFGCTKLIKQSETQGKSFFRSPAEFALTLPHLVWGRQESGYYEHFLFIKLELQELICLLGTFAEYKAASCPARTTCLCGRSPSVSGTGSTSSTSRVAKASPWLVSKARSRFFWPGVRAFLWKATALCICIAIVSLTWILLALTQVAAKHRVFYRGSPAALFKGQVLGWPFLRKQRALQSHLREGLHLPRGSDPCS